MSRVSVDSETAAVMVEPIQGEGGINIPSANYLPGLRKLCDDRGRASRDPRRGADGHGQDRRVVRLPAHADHT